MKPVLIMIAAASLALPALGQEREIVPSREIPSILVTGNSEVHAAPDEATVRLGVSRQASTAAAAQNGANEVAQSILAGVTGLGIDRKQIQTGQLTLYPIYAPQKPGSEDEPRVVAYRATNTVNIRLTEMARVGPVIDAGLKAGANQVEGVYFSLKNDGAAREAALRQAVVEARDKARSIASALDVRLGDVLTVQEGGVNLRPPQPLAGVAMMARRADVATPVEPGEVTVSASVTIRYRIGAH
jgi:uncharacterized protein YggE